MVLHNSGSVKTGTPATAIDENDGGSAAPSRRAFSVREFCVRYGIGRTHAYQEIAASRLRAVKVGRRTLIPHDAAEAWLAALPELNSRGQ
ncbi:MAG: excisionase family DNA-binding protein [Candidatus Binataceae bacterium]